MNCHLVFVHGRSQHHKDPDELKRIWVNAWKEGLAKSGLGLPIPESNIHFPYYGQALFDLVSDSAAEPAEIVLRGGNADVDERQFAYALLSETLEKFGISTNQVLETVVTTDRGALNTPIIRAMLQALDRHVPGASSLSVALATRDVYHYLSNPGIRDKIDGGVRGAITPGVPTVVVSHSLGTVVTYNLLRREGAELGFNVPLFVTLGSPLAVSTIKEKLRPLKAVTCAGVWFNAMDSRDIVSLQPLDATHFGITPAIENKTDVDNPTENRHGITGYLSDATVARRIYEAFVDNGQ